MQESNLDVTKVVSFVKMAVKQPKVCSPLKTSFIWTIGPTSPSQVTKLSLDLPPHHKSQSYHWTYLPIRNHKAITGPTSTSQVTKLSLDLPPYHKSQSYHWTYLPIRSHKAITGPTSPLCHKPIIDWTYLLITSHKAITGPTSPSRHKAITGPTSPSQVTKLSLDLPLHYKSQTYH